MAFLESLKTTAGIMLLVLLSLFGIGEKNKPEPYTHKEITVPDRTKTYAPVSDTAVTPNVGNAGTEKSPDTPEVSEPAKEADPVNSTIEETEALTELSDSEEAPVSEELPVSEDVPVSEEIPALEEKPFCELAPTVGMSFEELVGDNGIYDIPEYMPQPGTYQLIVDLRYQVIMAYKKGESGEYDVPVRYMLCSTGADETQSPEGTFEMKDYRVRFGKFNGLDCYAQYWSLITGRIYFHSVLYSEREAAYYTETSYNNIGTNVSHGCIRLMVPDARWIWYNCAPGTLVTIREGSKNDKETARIREMLTLCELPDKRPALKPGKVPYTDNWQITDVPAEYKFINGSQ